MYVYFQTSISPHFCKRPNGILPCSCDTQVPVFQNLSINLSFLLTGYTGPLSHRAAPVHSHGGSTQLHTRAKQVRQNKKNVRHLLVRYLVL
jgi:hypothetical protein